MQLSIKPTQKSIIEKVLGFKENKLIQEELKEKKIESGEIK